MALVETTGCGMENDPPRQPGDGPNTDKVGADGLICVICREEIGPERALLDCGHLFCYICLSTWANTATECPSCRRPFLSATKITAGDMETSGAKRKRCTVSFPERIQRVPLDDDAFLPPQPQPQEERRWPALMAVANLASSARGRYLDPFFGRPYQSRDDFIVPSANAAAGQAAMERSRQASRIQHQALVEQAEAARVAAAARAAARAAASRAAALRSAAADTPAVRRAAEWLSMNYEMRRAVVRRVVALGEAREAAAAAAREAAAAAAREANPSSEDESSDDEYESSEEDEVAPEVPVSPAAAAAAVRPLPLEIRAARSPPPSAESQPAAGRAAEVVEEEEEDVEVGVDVEEEVEARSPIVRPDNSANAAAAVPVDLYPGYVRSPQNSRAARVSNFAVLTSAAAAAAAAAAASAAPVASARFDVPTATAVAAAAAAAAFPLARLSDQAAGAIFEDDDL